MDDRLEEWKQAVFNNETHDSYEEWKNKTPVKLDGLILADIYEDIKVAKSTFREYVRPVAISLLGEWAGDDDTAHKLGRSWFCTATKYDGAKVKSIQFTETLVGFGHNETTTKKHVKYDIE